MLLVEDNPIGEGKYVGRKEYPLSDIVLLDIKMPGIDGHAVLRKIRGRQGHAL